MNDLLSNPFVGIVLATIFFIVANMVAGTIIADKEGKFEWNVLWGSIYKYIGILIVAALMYVGGYFGDEVFADYVNDYINIKNLVSLGLATYGANRAIDCINNWVELTNIKEVDKVE